MFFDRTYGMLIRVLVALLFLIQFSCKESSEDPPTGPGGGGGGSTPVPEGVLLTGADGDPAKGALTDLPPYPADPANIASDGFMMTRMSGVISPTATVKGVNDALISTGVRIDAMTVDNLVISLNTPVLPDKNAADSVAAVLEATGVFLFVFPGYAVTIESAVDSRNQKNALPSELPVNPDDSGIVHLMPPRAPAAWNAKRLAVSNASTIPILVPDGYSQLSPNPEISNQVFISGGSATNNSGGNHGFHVCGIIAARHDSSGSTGNHPTADLTLQVRSLPATGMTWSARLNLIKTKLPPAGKFVLNTSIGYNDPDFTTFSYEERILWAMAWRKIMLSATGRIIHAAAAGNDGDVTGDGAKAEYTSPFTASAMVADLTDLIPSGKLTLDEINRIDSAWNEYVSTDPSMAFRTVHTIVVGNSRLDGSENPGSSRPSDVRMIGTGVYAPCVTPESGGTPWDCNGVRELKTGTSMASPQVAGLAAYLWNLKPSLSVGDLRSVITGSYNSSNGVIDMYDAVLMLDGSLNMAVVRASILDVAGSDPSPGANGAFDVNDIEAYLVKFEEYKLDRESSGQQVQDYSRYDLNGNGITGDTAGQTVAFDLDVNSPPQYTTVTEKIGPSDKDFDETALSDLDILCYYAWSPLFTGDPSLRDDILRDCIDPDTIVVEVTFPSSISASGKAELQIRAGYRGDGSTVDWGEGIDISLNVTLGVADSTAGSTDVDGWFKTEITADSDPNQTLTIDITVSDLFGDTTTRQVTAIITDELAIEVGFVNEPAFPPFILTAPDTMIVRVGPRLVGDTIDYQPGFDIFVQVIGGTAFPTAGTTNTDKIFASRVDFNPLSDSMTIVITASKDGESVVDTIIAKKPTGPPGRVKVWRRLYSAAAYSNSSASFGTNPPQLDEFNVDSLTDGTTGNVSTSNSYSDPKWGFTGSGSHTGNVSTSAVYDTAGNIIHMTASGGGSATASATAPTDPDAPTGWGAGGGGNESVALYVEVTEGNVLMQVSGFIESVIDPGWDFGNSAVAVINISPPDGPNEVIRNQQKGSGRTFNVSRMLEPGTLVIIGFGSACNAGIAGNGVSAPSGSASFSADVTFTPFGTP